MSRVLSEHLLEELSEERIEPVVEFFSDDPLLESGVLLDVNLSELPQLLVVDLRLARGLLLELQTCKVRLRHRGMRSPGFKKNKKKVWVEECMM